MNFNSSAKTWITDHHVSRQSSASYDVLTVSLEESPALPLLDTLYTLGSLILSSLPQCAELSECSMANVNGLNFTYESIRQYLPQEYSNILRSVQMLSSSKVASNPPSKGEPILYINGEKVSHVFQILNSIVFSWKFDFQKKGFSTWSFFHCFSFHVVKHKWTSISLFVGRSV